MFSETWFPFRPHVPLLLYSQSTPKTLQAVLDRDGIAVVTGVLPPSFCDRIAKQMARWLGNHGVDVQDPRTWSRYTNEFFEMSPSILGMMNTGPIRNATFVRAARRHESVRRLMEMVYGTSSLAMEDGGVFWGFPPEHYPRGRIPGERYGGFMGPTDMWMHTDRGRDFLKPGKLMSLIMMEEAGFEDYSFVFLEKSHVHHDAFLKTHPKLAMEEDDPKNGYIQLDFDDTRWFEKQGCTWRKVVAPKGSVIVWSDRLIHSTCLPVRARKRPNPRFVVYGTFAPK